MERKLRCAYAHNIRDLSAAAAAVGGGLVCVLRCVDLHRQVDIRNAFGCLAGWLAGWLVIFDDCRFHF